MKKQRDLLLISVDSPILLGIYEDKRLVKSYARMGKFSDTLPQLFSEILREARESKAYFNIYYANGPGNFSAIKLTHIFLQTLQITLNAIVSPLTKSAHESQGASQVSAYPPRQIRLFCADAFHFSNSEFINAYGKIHFYKESAPDSTQSGAIHTIALDSKRPNSFALPQSLDSRIFSEDCTPLYILPAV